MAAKFKVGKHVTWNSEAGHVSGKVSSFTDALGAESKAPALSGITPVTGNDRGSK
jgi:hypothetical protein